MEIKDFIKKNEHQIIKDLEAVVSHNSVSKYQEGAINPFGDEVKAVLDEALNIFKREGFKAINVDNYAGYAEIGHGEKLIGILGHLDVVPAGKGWSYDPFTITEVNGKLYGRGTMDDKGPVIAAFYALKYLKEENIDFNKRIRLIVGCNEEAGSRGLAYYVKKEGHIDYGFTPDGSFPGIYGEKANCGAGFAVKDSRIINIEGGTVPNAVCSEVTIELPLEQINEELLENYLNTKHIKYTKNKAKTLTYTVYGVAAHASTPEFGVNAISYLMKGLEEAKFDDPLVRYYNKHIGLFTDGTLAKVKMADKYGPLTFNNGMIYKKDQVIYGTIDIRVPVTKDADKVKDTIIAEFNDQDGKTTYTYNGKPLFFDPDSPMVKALVSAYQEVTGDKKNKPLVIGGGTYSKGINNCIAFGGEFPDVDYHIHDKDEFIYKEHLLKQIEIYVKAIKNLLAL